MIQHQFWDLKVHEDYFEISLTFSKVLEKLVIPYAAVKGFFDPSVQFGLQFQGDAEKGEGGQLPAPEAMKQLPPTGTEGTASDGEPEEEHGQVVSLDAFRKK